MTTNEAKVVLLAYRPGVDDAQDPEVSQALALCESDAELARWFKSHCEQQNLLRAKMRGIKAPEGLAQQIISEQRARVTLPHRRRALLAAVATFIIIAAGVSLWRTANRNSGEDLSFNGYRQRMVKTALRAYGMDLETNSVAAVRTFLINNRAPADFELPQALSETKTVGCGVMAWQGKPVTMVCFRTGKPLDVGMKSDLFLFVISDQDIKAGAPAAEKSFAKVSELATASWRSGDKVYVLAAFSDDDLKAHL